MGQTLAMEEQRLSCYKNDIYLDLFMTLPGHGAVPLLSFPVNF
jgi:hypothetical protein